MPIRVNSTKKHQRQQVAHNFRHSIRLSFEQVDDKLKSDQVFVMQCHTSADKCAPDQQIAAYLLRPHKSLRQQRREKTPIAMLSRIPVPPTKTMTFPILAHKVLIQSIHTVILVI